MKAKQFLISIVFLFSVTINYAQASFTQAGIAVQGIVRDANNTAIQNQTVSLEFEFYYFNDLNALVTVGSVIVKQVVTDNFGVFSTIINPNSANNQVFSNNQVWLRIRKQGDTAYMSESLLSHVPYAISANNGVPTGTILPFVGKAADVPNGWALCDGSQIPAGATALAALLAPETAVPNLQGRFLKGVGTTVETNVEPIGLNTTQSQSTQTKQHTHASGNLTAANTDAVAIGRAVATFDSTDLNFGLTFGDGGGVLYPFSRSPLQSSPLNHSHSVEGDTADSAIDNSEVRPSSYGVNYIIKL